MHEEKKRIEVDVKVRSTRMRVPLHTTVHAVVAVGAITHRRSVAKTWSKRNENQMTIVGD